MQIKQKIKDFNWGLLLLIAFCIIFWVIICEKLYSYTPPKSTDSNTCPITFKDE